MVMVMMSVVVVMMVVVVDVVVDGGCGDNYGGGGGVDLPSQVVAWLAHHVSPAGSGGTGALQHACQPA